MKSLFSFIPRSFSVCAFPLYLALSGFGQVQAQSNEHVLLHDINQTPNTFASKLSPRNLVSYKQRILFSGISPVTGREVWQYDLTTKQSSLLVDVLPGTESADVEDLVVVEDYLFFFANKDRHDNGSISRYKELWRYNLVSGELKALTDLDIEFDYDSYILQRSNTPVLFNNRLYFTIRGKVPARLYQLDLASLKVSEVESSSEDPLDTLEDIVVFDQKLFFISGDRLHSLNQEGQLHAFTQALGLNSDQQESFYLVDEKLFVKTTNNQFGFLLVEQGTNQTRQLEEIYPISESAQWDYLQPLVGNKDGFWFSAVKDNSESGFWKFDKSTQSTQFIETVDYVRFLRHLREFAGKAYYHLSYSHDLVEFNPVAETSRILGYLPIYGENAPEATFKISESVIWGEDELYFAGGTSVEDDGENLVLTTDTLWQVDTTTLEQRRLTQPITATKSSFPTNFTAIGDKVFFTATEDNGTRPLWVLDAVTNEVAKLDDSDDAQFPSSRYPGELTAVWNNLFFVESDQNNVNQIWRKNLETDDLSIVTQFPATNENGFRYRRPDALGTVNGILYFTVELTSPDFDHRKLFSELWKFDLESSKLEKLTEFSLGVGDARYFSDVFLFSGYSPSDSDGVLWTYDPATGQQNIISDERRHFYTTPVIMANEQETVYVKSTVFYDNFSAETLFEVDVNNGSLRRLFSPEDISGETIWDLKKYESNLYFSTADGNLWHFDTSNASLQLLAEEVNAGFVVGGNYLYFFPYGSGSLHYLILETGEKRQFPITRLSNASVFYTDGSRLEAVADKIYSSAMIMVNDKFYGEELVAVNLWPVPIVKVDFPLVVDEGQTVILNAAESFDKYNTPLRFSWWQRSGLNLDLSDMNEAVIEFKAPGVNATEEMEVVVYVGNERIENTANISITINDVNAEPQLEVSANKQQANGGESITINADVTDSDADDISYQWSQVSGRSSVDMTSANSTFTFNAPESASTDVYEFSVTASDGIHLVTKSVKIEVAAVSQEPAPVNQSGGGGSFAWLLTLLLFVSAIRFNRIDLKSKQALV